jgi:hypothetical protein
MIVGKVLSFKTLVLPLCLLLLLLLLLLQCQVQDLVGVDCAGMEVAG